MSEDLRDAFMHPEARAVATAGAKQLDRISLRNHIAEVEIGAFQAERGIRQRLSFNLVVEVAPHSDADDDVDRVLSYDRLTEAVETELATERFNLLETLAERIADRILDECRAMRVFVRIEKLDRGAAALGVEIVRSKDGRSGRTVTVDRQKALCQTVVFLSGTDAASTGPSAILDRLNPDRQRAIFCIGPDVVTATLPEHPQLRRRLVLLAMEQAAWSFSALDSRIAVTDTRTELEWALNNDRIPVWAPSKMVLGAVEMSQADDPLGLVVWFARQVGAVELVTVGVAPPANAGIACRELTLETMG